MSMFEDQETCRIYSEFHMNHGKTSEDKQDADQERFRIENDGQADWALEKIRDLKEKQKENEELAEERKAPLEKKIAKIEAWQDQQNEKLQDNIEYFEGILTEYAMKLKEDDEDLKTHSLPFGKLRFRKQRPKWKYHESMLLNSLKKAGRDDLIKIKESVDKRELKKQVDVAGSQVVDLETGEIIEGVEVQERGEKFSIDVEEGD
ncbi:MAG: Mu-like prophage host-nuclease inhibitor protein Gam [Candidatus Frackibacter sp. T328-2]|nr:MAG: Mu-like prophage host-nuclease inhibitor protein Gam [Candidatus Frackibacter sp. T328-2]